MSDIELDFRVLGYVGTNCYLLKNMQTKECVLIDPADEFEKIKAMVEKSGCSLKGILLTHGHYDHILAADEARKYFGVNIYASKEEQVILVEPDNNLSSSYGMNISLLADVWHEDGDILKLGGIEFLVLHTPGHTAGGACYYVKSEGILFSGDTLFAESVGRTDFPTGSMSSIVRSIKEKIMTLPDDTIVFPGHGESTKVSYERKYNPFIQG